MLLFITMLRFTYEMETLCFYCVSINGFRNMCFHGEANASLREGIQEMKNGLMHLLTLVTGVCVNASLPPSRSFARPLARSRTFSRSVLYLYLYIYI